MSLLTAGWDDLPDARFARKVLEVNPIVDPNGVAAHEVVFWFHPDSLAAERLGIVFEYRVVNRHVDPWFRLEVVGGPVVTIEDAYLIDPADPDTFRVKMLVPRNEANAPFGWLVDTIKYENRGIVAQRFTTEDLGKRGDINLDNLVDGADLQIVLDNIGQSGDTEVAEGDANLDGVIDADDAMIVVDDATN